MTLPGAGPPTAAERALAALKSQSVNTGRGAVQTRSATRRPPTEPYRAPASGGGIVAFAEFDDPTDSGDVFYQIDPSDFYAGEGDYASYMAYDNSGSVPGVMMTSLGWYQVFLHIQVTDLALGDVVHMRVHWPSAGYDNDAYGISDGSGVSMSLTTLPSKNYNTTGMITAFIDNPAGGTINTAQFHVMKWTGV